MSTEQAYESAFFQFFILCSVGGREALDRASKDHLINLG
jgi:hypothetical protein